MTKHAITVTFTLLILIGVGYFFWGYFNLDNAILIRNYSPASNEQITWGLVNFKGDKPQVYSINYSLGYWSIVLYLWPIILPWLVLNYALIPIGKITIHYFQNKQISDAKKERDVAFNQRSKIQKDYEKRLSQAHEREKIKLLENYAVHKKQLDQLSIKLDLKEQKITNRETAITKREHEITQRENNAENKVEQIISEYKSELQRFNHEKALYAKRKNNAVHTMQRRAKKKK